MDNIREARAFFLRLQNLPWNYTNPLRSNHPTCLQTQSRPEQYWQTNHFCCHQCYILGLTWCHQAAAAGPGKAEGEAPPKNLRRVRCVETCTFALYDWKAMSDIQLVKAWFWGGRSEWLLTCCARYSLEMLTLPEPGLSNVQRSSTLQKAPQFKFHCQEPRWLVPSI